MLHAGISLVFDGGVSGQENCLLIAATLFVKKVAKASAVRLVAGGGGGGLRRVLKVENSFLASVEVRNLLLKYVFLAAEMEEENEAS